MNKKCIMLFIAVFLLACPSLSAEQQEHSSRWKHTSLLDLQTKSKLLQSESYFDELFEYPQEYKNASKSEKMALQKNWVKELNGADIEKATLAAANLGIVRSKPAARFIEKAVFKKGGRFRWVCTRSLGQIRQKSSIPILIDLLDNPQKDAQLYARVSLAEITGVYLGEDKEKWLAWHKDPSAVTCTEDRCIIPTDASQKNKATDSQTKIRFTLPDTFGRIVKSKDYLGSPVLYIFGSCWCGGCQQDMQPFREFVAKNQSTGLQGVRVVALDNELAALGFQKHYRLNCVQLLDTNRTLEKSLNNRGGWTFLVLADPDGNLIYRANNPREDDYKAIYKILKSNSKRTLTETVEQNGVQYMPATIERNKTRNTIVNERFPSVATGSDGNIYVVFTRTRKDLSDVVMRKAEGNKWSQDIPIATSPADEYDGNVLVDSTGKVWISWISNANGKYNIFITSLDNSGQTQRPYQLTHSDDDAMHPRMTYDTQGNLWITYYHWKKRNGRSRDKEVYVRQLNQNRWSKEIQISPTDVPWYEDHTEPAITAYNDGVMIAWSWDFHPPNQGYSQYAESPTIFLRPINRQMELGKIFSVSKNSVDVTPAIITSGDRILCAWDSTAVVAKNLSVASVIPNQDNPPKNILQHEKVRNMCTPCLTKSKHGQISLIWCESPNGIKWILKHMTYMPKEKQWSTPSIVMQEGNPRFPSAAYDSKEQLWVACSVETADGRKIVLKTLSKEK